MAGKTKTTKPRSPQAVRRAPAAAGPRRRPETSTPGPGAAIARRAAAGAVPGARDGRTLQRALGNRRVGALSGGPVQRKCAGGEGCECAGCQAQRRPVQRRATAATTPATLPDSVRRVLPRGGGQPLAPDIRGRMEPALGTNLGGVRVHTGPDVARAAADIDADAFTHGQNVFFAANRFAPQTGDGRELLAHELVHTVQQRGGGTALQGSPAISRPDDPLEHEADRIARRVAQGAPAPADQVRTPAEPTVQRQFGGFGGGSFGGGGAGGSFGDDGGDGDTGGGGLWDTAMAIARAIGGSISISGGRLVIDVLALNVCPAPIVLSIDLPGVASSLTVPVWQYHIGGTVFAYGAVGVSASAMPYAALQIGPCTLHGLRIAVDPLGGSASAAGAFTATAGVLGGMEIRAGGREQFGLLVIPDPPIPLPIPLAGMELGLMGQAQFIGAQTLSSAFYFSLSTSGLRASTASSLDLGVALDIGVGAYGSLDLLGQEICTFTWPFWEWHGQRATNFLVTADLVIDAAGPSLSYQLVLAQPIEIPFEEIGAAFDRELLQPDCELCGALYALGLMPSQLGGPWPYHPTPPWSDGPLKDVYPRSPKDLNGDFPSDALCRGACGVDCNRCDVQGQEVYECEQIGDRHRWWRYPDWNVCGSHRGCRDHDACYDWAVGAGEGSILGPLHRLCDFECLCQYGLANCLPWAVGAGDKPDTMRFSNRPEPRPGCRGPCPEDGEGGPQPSGTKYRIELEPVPLFDAVSRSKELFDQAVDTPIWAGVIPDTPITVELSASAGLKASANGTIGPAMITGLIFEADPSAGTYIGQGHVEARGAASLAVIANGGLELSSHVLGVVPLASVPANLRADALATADGTFRIGGAITFHCRQGDPGFDTRLDLSLDACMSLDFALKAAISLRLLSVFEVARLHWDLASVHWGDCWHLGSMVEPMSAGAAVDENLVQLTIPTMEVLSLLGTLFEGDPKADHEKLERRCGTPQLPLTKKALATGTDRGEEVEFAPLTRCEGDTRGTLGDRHLFAAADAACTPTEGLKRRWPASHLVHGRTSRSGSRTMHGPGDQAWNVILADNIINKDLSHQVEQPVLRRLYDNDEVLWYNVKVKAASNTGHHRYFADRFEVSWGHYDTADGSKGPREGHGTPFTRDATRRPLPVC